VCHAVANDITHQLFTFDKAKLRETLIRLVQNLGDNAQLRSNVLTRSISANRLVHMEAEEMANEREKALREEIKEKSMQQAVLTDSDAHALYRTTHKGVELVEYPHDAPGTSVTDTLIEALPTTTSTSSTSTSSSSSSSSTNQLHEPTDQATADLAGNTEHSRRLSASDDGFKFFSNARSNVDNSAATTKHSLQSVTAATAGSSGGGVTAIGRSLPKPKIDLGSGALNCTTSEPLPMPSLWHGVIDKSPNLESCSAKALHVCGDSSITYIRTDAVLAIKGRMHKEQLMTYLSDLDLSTSVVRVAMIMQPFTATDTPGFEAIFEYFLEKERAAVLDVRLPEFDACVREAYIVPLSRSESMPPWITRNAEVSALLHINHIDKLLLVLVVHKSRIASAAKSSSMSLASPAPIASVSTPIATHSPASSSSSSSLHNSFSDLIGDPSNHTNTNSTPQHYHQQQQQQQHPPPFTSSSSSTTTAPTYPYTQQHLQPHALPPHHQPPRPLYDPFNASSTGDTPSHHQPQQHVAAYNNNNNAQLPMQQHQQYQSSHYQSPAVGDPRQGLYQQQQQQQQQQQHYHQQQPQHLPPPHQQQLHQGYLPQQHYQQNYHHQQQQHRGGTQQQQHQQQHHQQSHHHQSGSNHRY
jgi:hypothetical protein